MKTNTVLPDVKTAKEVQELSQESWATFANRKLKTPVGRRRVAQARRNFVGSKLIMKGRSR